MTRRAIGAVLWALAAWIVVASASESEEATLPRAVLEVSPLRGTVGDALEARIEVVTPQGFLVERPELGPLGSFTFKARSWEGPLESEGVLRWSWSGTVAAFETGELELPAVTIRVSGPEGERTLRTAPVGIDIRSVIPEGDSEENLADLKGPAGVPPDYGALRRAVLILLILLAISGVAWWLHRRWAHRLSAVAVPSDPFHRMPPHEWVYKELQHLLERRLAEQGEVDPFYSELSRILKMYLGGRYRVDLMEKTTAEVPDELRAVGTPREAALGAREILEGADRVKFAGDRPTPPECREAVEAVYRVVDATRPADAAGDADRGAAA
jgi:hypothetical protein